MVQSIDNNSYGVMPESVAPQIAASMQPQAEMRIWGLTAQQLHDAYWRSKGVQCIRWGQPEQLQRAAELFLLIDPDQLVWFDIALLSDRLTWRDAAITRIQLHSESPQNYSERVVVDDRGLVHRIERRYRTERPHTARVLMTSVQRIARAWMTAKSRREGSNRVRRLGVWTHVDHLQCAGQTFCARNVPQEQKFISALVERWRYPNQVIAGLQELESGVWCVAGHAASADAVRFGPLWLGFGADQRSERCMIGPAWVEDQMEVKPRSDAGVNVRNITDIEATDHTQAEVLHRPMPSSAYLALKRIMDIVCSAMALIVGLPIMIAVAACILLDDGRPLFFGHTRQGCNGKPFRCWKFRTMQRDAHAKARQFQAQNLCDGPQVLIKNDPRVTRIGKLLRVSHLDELPQFWNVLTGQMSLVGPRPSPDDENQYCPAWRDLRLSVRPGITGLWQLKRTRGQGKDFQEWIQYDTQYVQNASLWLDVMILFRTAIMIVSGKRRSADGQND